MSSILKCHFKYISEKYIMPISEKYIKIRLKVYFPIFSLKGSYDVAKKNIILCNWCNAMCLCSLRFKKTHYFPHTVHYCCSSMLRYSEMCRFLQSSSLWEARRALIGQLSSALWLAEYLKREAEMLRPSLYCDAVSWQDDKKNNKTHL